MKNPFSWLFGWKSKTPVPAKVPLPPALPEKKLPNYKRFNSMTAGRLVRLDMTIEEYDALPNVYSIVGDMLLNVELGFRFKAEDGHVCEVVKGEDMFEFQWASMSVPERGLRHYNPVIPRPLFALSGVR